MRTINSISLVLLLATACGPSSAPPTTTPPTDATSEPAVAPIPEGFSTLTPQLTIKGVDDAIVFYEKALGAERLLVLPGPTGATMHAEIRIGDSIVMLDEENPEWGMQSPLALGGTPATLMLSLEDADAAYTTAVEAGATAAMPVEEQFWGDRYGEIVDPFGHRWALATHVEDLTPEQIQQRAQLLAPPPPEDGKGKGNKGNKGNVDAPPPWKQIAGTPATDPTPEPYHTVNLALTVDDAARAMEYYEQVLGATERGVLPDGNGKIMHAELSIGDSVLMLSDEYPEMGSSSAKTLGGSCVGVLMYVEDVDAAIAHATETGAAIQTPPAEMFWGDRYASLVDASGYLWGVATRVANLTPEQMQERMAAQGDVTAPTETDSAPAG